MDPNQMDPEGMAGMGMDMGMGMGGPGMGMADPYAMDPYGAGAGGPMPPMQNMPDMFPGTNMPMPAGPPGMPPGMQNMQNGMPPMPQQPMPY